MTTSFDSSPRAGLAAAVESSRIAWMGLGAAWPGWVQHDDPDLLWRIAPSMPHTAMNTATRARFDPSIADARIDSILGAYRQHGLPLVWWVGPSAQPADLARRLAARGLTDHGVVPGMAADLSHLPATATPPGLTIRPVNGHAAIRQYVSIMGEANDWPPPLIDAFAALYRHLIEIEGASLSLLLGWLEDRPVGTAALFVAGGVAGVYNICTIPAARGRGVGSAMTLAIMQVARMMGFAFAVLQASDMGVNLYRTLGFEEVCAFDYFVLG